MVILCHPGPKVQPDSGSTTSRPLHLGCSVMDLHLCVDAGAATIRPWSESNWIGPFLVLNVFVGLSWTSTKFYQSHPSEKDLHCHWQRQRVNNGTRYTLGKLNTEAENRSLEEKRPCWDPSFVRFHVSFHRCRWKLPMLGTASRPQLDQHLWRRGWGRNKGLAEKFFVSWSLAMTWSKALHHQMETFSVQDSQCPGCGEEP